MTESIKIWVAIRNSATKLHNAGANPGDILRWSQKRSLNEVRGRLHKILCVEEKDGGKEADEVDIRNAGDIRKNTKV